MSTQNLKPGHRHAPSLETNASALAESTISLGQISRFPEPPSSIPGSPMRLGFDSPSTPTTPTSRYQPRRLPNPPPTSYTRSPDQSPSLKSSSPSGPTLQHPPPYSAASPQHSSSPNLSAHDWHDGASSIDPNGAEDRMLPTSLITSLLHDNKLRRNSYSSSVAFSGISEITYPPVAYHSTGSPASPGFTDKSLPDGRRPESGSTVHEHPQAPKRQSTQSDCETLASMGNYPIHLVRSPYRSSALHASTVFSQDSETIRSVDMFYQNKLATTYEHSDELDYRPNPNGDQPAFLSVDPAQGRPTDIASHSKRRSNTSFSSTKTTGTFLSRLSSGLSIRHAFRVRRKSRPLPKLPSEDQSYRKLDESTPLPNLIQRAGVLHSMLENGQRPYSNPTTPTTTNFGETVFDPSTRYTSFGDPRSPDLQESKHEGSIRLPYGLVVSNPFYSPPSSQHPKSKKKFRVLVATGVFLLLLIIGIVVGVVVGKRKQTPQYHCQGTMTGSTCLLNAACVCTSTGQCNPIAQSVMDLIPSVNELFDANYTASSTFQSFWLMQGNPSPDNCAMQAGVLDIGKSFDQKLFPNRTRWLQAALLWNALQTMDPGVSKKMQAFVQSLPWSSLTSDSPSTAKGSSFSMTVAGFNFDFAAQTLSEPAANFVTLSQAPSSQIQKLSTNSQSTLDRMYAFAQASSNQRTSALQKYWTSVLQQNSNSLAVFKAALSASPILLPFNASSSAVRDLYSTSTFPPPLSCYPGLEPSTQQQLNAFENVALNLPNVQGASTFDRSCFTDRPIYGVLDVLRLRLPFPDAIPGMAQQATILDHSATPRIVVYPASPSPTSRGGSVTFIPSQFDPRQYGTFSYFDHVVLQYLTSMPDVSTANAVVNFVIQQVTTPPTSAALLPVLSRVPVMEVAVFGQVGPSDLTGVVSPFTTPSGSLFFGSSDGTSLRNWTITAVQQDVIWTQNATSPTVLRDSTLDSNNIISKTWAAASAAINQQISNVGLVNITNSLDPQFTP